MRTLKQYLLILTAFSLVAMSCQNREEEDDTLQEAPESVPTENNNQADAFYTHVYTVVNTEVNNAEEEALKTGSVNGNDPCATVTYVVNIGGQWLDSVIIDYGSAGCDWEGRTRKGKIIITLDGKIKDPGTVAVVTADGFSVDDYKVEGKMTITNNGFDFATLTSSVTTTVENASVTSPDLTKSFTWEATRTITYVWLSRMALADGSASGVDQNGNAFSVATTKSLKAIQGCKYLVEGTVEVSPAGKSIRTVDYGDGTCDNQATIMIDGVKYALTMK